MGLPAFGDLGGSQPAFIAPAAGVIRALDVALNEYQTGGQDFVAAWDTANGQLMPGYPRPVNDLQFLTGPAVGDVGGSAGEEVVAGTASMDLVALSRTGVPTSGRWPKLTTDWTIATPLLGSLGTVDTAPGAPRVVVNLTRSGYINAYGTGAGACAPASSPRFHHDNANSGDFRRDATLPGRPYDRTVSDGEIVFRAPGDDLLCRAADAYEVVTSTGPITAANFGDAGPLGGAPDPGAPGSAQTYAPPAGAERYVAIRAVDEQGNVGRPLTVDLGGGEPPPGGECETTLKGTGGPDRLIGTGGSELIRGRGGNDRIRARGGDDCVRAGRGRDRVKGGAGDDLIRALGRGLDRVNCGPGEDTVVAGRRDRVRKNCETVTRP
jgi:Ca2+-binding RTX toxin-like protein